MFNLFALLAGLFATNKIVKEKIEPTAPANTRFDWEAYNDDVRNGISAMEQVRKIESGGYFTTTQLPEQTIPSNGVLDKKRYEHDKKVYGEAIAEINRKNGSYKYIRDY